MASWTLRKATASTFDIRLGGRKVGFARKLDSGSNAGKFVARINNGDVVIRDTPNAAFTEAVRIANRIALVGKNDAEAARKELDRRNAAVAEEVREANEAWEATGISDIMRKHGWGGGGVKIRRRKIAL